MPEQKMKTRRKSLITSAIGGTFLTTPKSRDAMDGGGGNFQISLGSTGLLSGAIFGLALAASPFVGHLDGTTKAGAAEIQKAYVDGAQGLAGDPLDETSQIWYVTDPAKSDWIADAAVLMAHHLICGCGSTYQDALQYQTVTAQDRAKLIYAVHSPSPTPLSLADAVDQYVGADKLQTIGFGHHVVELDNFTAGLAILNAMYTGESDVDAAIRRIAAQIADDAITGADKTTFPILGGTAEDKTVEGKRSIFSMIKDGETGVQQGATWNESQIKPDDNGIYLALSGTIQTEWPLEVDAWTELTATSGTIQMDMPEVDKIVVQAGGWPELTATSGTGAATQFVGV